MLEREFQAKVISELKERYKGCVIIKNDANYIQGFPDLLILYRDTWIALEVKQSANAHYQPNQKWWLECLSTMSLATTIYPENKDIVFNAIDNYLESHYGF